MTTITNNTTNINIVPVRISADHYQIQSFTKTNKIYNQKYNYDLKRWICDCGDATKNHSQNCKHNILLRAYIKQAAQQTPAAKQDHSNSAELMQILTRISNLEHAQETTEREHLLLQRDIEENNFQISARAEQEQILRQQVFDLQNKCNAAQTEREELQYELKQQSYAISRQEKQIAYQADLIGALQTSVCRLNEITIQQDETIKKLLAAHDQLANFAQEMYLQAQEYKRMLEDQAQQIDALHDQMEGQARPEQTLRIVVEQPASAPRQARETKAEDATIKPIKDQSGKITSCKVGKFTVKVLGNCAAGCDCSIGIMDRQCPHMVKIDQFLSK